MRWIDKYRKFKDRLPKSVRLAIRISAGVLILTAGSAVSYFDDEWRYRHCQDELLMEKVSPHLCEATRKKAKPPDAQKEGRH